MERLASSFTDLATRWSVDGCELNTLELCSACSGLSEVLSAVGGPAFAFAALDYDKKVVSMREAAASGEPAARTCSALVAADAAAGRLRTQGSLARNLWRVLNALRFCRELFLGILPDASAPAAAAAAADAVVLSDVVWRSYEATMAASHLWSIRQVVWLAMWAVPTRAVFLDTLASHTPGGAPAADAAARTFVAAAEVIIARLDALYDGPCTDANGA